MLHPYKHFPTLSVSLSSSISVCTVRNMQISSSFEVKTLFEFSTCYIRCRNEIQSQSLEIFMEHKTVLSNHYMHIKIAEILWDPHSYYLS